MLVTKRSTYDFLSWLGDIGGLWSSMFSLGAITMSAYSSYNMNALLLTTLFRMAPSSSNREKYAICEANLSNKAAIKVGHSIF